MELMLIWMLAVLVICYFWLVNGTAHRLDALRTDLAQLKADVVALRSDITLMARADTSPVWRGVIQPEKSHAEV